MKAAVYARTCKREKVHNTTNVENQVAYCRELAARHGLSVEREHVFTDVEMPGDLAPTCWAGPGDLSRPALSGLIEAIESGAVRRVVVRHVEKLGTASDVLTGLLGLFDARDVYVVSTRDEIENSDDPSRRFAASVLRARILVDTEGDRERTRLLKVRKLAEIRRLEERIARLEDEIAALPCPGS